MKEEIKEIKIDLLEKIVVKPNFKNNKLFTDFYRS